MKKLLFVVLGLILIAPPVYGISNLTITPSDPKVGDIITITGKANPKEDINCQIYFEVDPLIAPPYYGYIINNIEIPTTPNSFKIVAENVNSLSISTKVGIWVTRRVEANEKGVAIFSKSNIPRGNYDIKIGGTIKDLEKPVKLKIYASTKIKADENGNFKYSYRINNIPEGTVVHLNIDGVKRDIVVKGSIPTPPPVDREEGDGSSSSNENSDKKENRPNTIHRNNTQGESYKDRRTSSDKSHYSKPINRTLDSKKITPPKLNRENVVYGTVIKNIGGTLLVIPEGIVVNTDEEISIKEISIPNTTVAYYISPRNVEFNKPLTLKIPYNISEGKKITVLYYDEHLKRWINIPYNYDGGTVTVKVSRSGYYAVKEENIEKMDKNIVEELYSTLELFKVVINLLLNYLQNLFK